MNQELYNLYGNYTSDGEWIRDHEKYHYYMTHPKEMKRKKRQAFLFLLIPIIGVVFYFEIYDQMGISVI